MNLSLWLVEMAQLLESFSIVDIGYPHGSNLLYPAIDGSLERLLCLSPVPTSVGEFYQLCGGLDLEDLDNGYFIHTPDQIAHGIENGEPTCVSGPYASRILFFGSDGGGGRYALRLESDDPRVLYLPSDGAVHSSVYDGERSKISVEAENFTAFLEALKANLRAWIYQ